MKHIFKRYFPGFGAGPERIKTNTRVKTDIVPKLAAIGLRRKLGSWSFFGRSKVLERDTREEEQFLYEHRLKRSLSDLPLAVPTSRRNIFGQIVITCLLVILAAAPLRSALAAGEYVTLSSFSGHPAVLQVSGGGWSPGRTVQIYLKDISTAPAATATVGAGGFFGPVSVSIPFNTPEGPLPVIATDGAGGNQAGNSYFVTRFTPSISVESTANTPGSALSVSGEGFAPGEQVELSMAGSVALVTASSAGVITNASLAVPNVSSGTYEVYGTGQSSGAKAVGYFFVGDFYPSVSPSSYYILPTQTLSFSGGGFAPGEAIDVYEDLNTNSLASFNADLSGNFVNAGGIVMLLGFVGTKTYCLVGRASGGRACAGVTVGNFNPNVFPSSYYILPSQQLAFSGGAFAANEQVSVYEDGKALPVASFQTDKNGAYENAGAVTIPFEYTNSSRTYTLKGQTSGGEVSVTVTVGQFNSLASPNLYHIKAGQELMFYGQGFAPGELIEISEQYSGKTAAVITADKNGGFADAGSLIIPFSYAGSSRTFILKGRSSGTEAVVIISVATFNPQASPSSYYVMPGTELIFSGWDFGAFEPVNIYKGESGALLATVAATDQYGTFVDDGSFKVPLDYAGTTLVLRFVGQASGAQTEISITISAFNPLLNPSTYYITPGKTLTVSGSGFAGGEDVVITMEGNAPVRVTASSIGEFIDAGPLTAPIREAGPLTITATGQDSKISAEAEISLGSLNPLVTPSSYYILSGSRLDFSGSGFAPNEEVVLSSGQQEMGFIPADKNGEFINRFISTPFGDDRSVTYTFTGKLSGATATVTVTIAGLHPLVSVDNYYVTPGSVLGVSGTGFAPGEEVAITAGSSNALAVADENGVASSTPITLPLDNGNANILKIIMTGKTSQASGFAEITLAPFTPQVDPSVWYTTPGTAVTFTGTGFAVNETVHISLNGSVVGSATANTDGEFTSAEITIPVTAAIANFVFNGEQSGARAAVEIGLAGFTPQVSPSSWYVAPGSQVTFTGSGFAPGEQVEISSGQTVIGTVAADDTGMFTSRPVTIPFNAAEIGFSFRSSDTNTVSSLTIAIAPLLPGLILSTYYNYGGAPLTISGLGFGAGEQVKITFAGIELGKITASADGEFVYSTAVPFGPAGEKTITAVGEASGASESATFTQPEVYVNVQLGSYAGAPGSAVTVVGSGFLPNEPVEIKTDRTGDTAAHSFTADKNGSFSNAGYKVPASFSPGQLTITVVGKHSFTGNSIVYYVTGP